MKKIVLIMMMLVNMNGFANDTLDLGDWINNEIEVSKSSLLDIKESNSNDNYDFALKGIMLRVRASFGIDIPFLAKAKVKPEIEFFWTK